MFVRPRAGLLLLALCLVACAAAPAFAARVNGIGLIDYTRKNAFKVGDWVRYKLEVANSNGREAVNFQEVRIVGEETFRGEPCFWVETWFGPDTLRAVYDLTLVSKDVFKDPEADLRYSIYIRLMMLDQDDDGRPEMTEVKRANNATELPDLSMYKGKVDTLGFEKIATPKGEFEGRLITMERKLRNPRDTADSTINKITHVMRKTWISHKIPITSLIAQDETEDWLVQAYKVGEVSTNAPEVPFSSENRKATVVDWGTGAKSALLAGWRAKKAENALPALKN